MPDDNQDAKRAAYQAWADRMKNKKADQQTDAPSETAAPAASYWSTDALFRGSQWETEQQTSRDVEQAGKDAEITRLLAMFGLPRTASYSDVTAVYRKFAKEVHPDLHTDKTTRTQASKIEKMVEINQAYDKLERLLNG